MPLKVKVISYKGRPPAERLEAFFDQAGGTLGRSTENRKNHFYLPDPDHFISRMHATITFQNNGFLLTDTSLDGTFIQNKNLRINRDTVPLADGDILKIGDYELAVNIDSSSPLSPFANVALEKESGDLGNMFAAIDTDPGGANSLFKGNPGSVKSNHLWPTDGSLEKSSLQSPTPVESSGPPDILPIHEPFIPPDTAGAVGQPVALPKDFNFEELFEDIAAPKAPSIPTILEQSPASSEELFPEIPEIVFSEPLDPDEKELSITIAKDEENPPASADPTPEQPIFAAPIASTPTPSAPTQSMPIPSTPTPSASSHQMAQLELARLFLTAAGLKDTEFLQTQNLADLMQTIGRVFHEMILGLMAMLRGRSELKAQFRVSATLLQTTDNNPLKFSRMVDEVIQQLLTQNKPGFIDATDAIRDSFADIMNHEMAMAAGIQASLGQLLERFSPQVFSKQFEEGVVFQKKAKTWDAYQNAYSKIVDDAIENFYGETFSRAYEEQISKLRSKSNAG